MDIWISGFQWKILVTAWDACKGNFFSQLYRRALERTNCRAWKLRKLKPMSLPGWRQFEWIEALQRTLLKLSKFSVAKREAVSALEILQGIQRTA
jgi:hypothetical protein